MCFVFTEFLDYIKSNNLTDCCKQVLSMKGTITCSHPHPSLEKFNGKLDIACSNDKHEKNTLSFSLTKNQLLLRGCGLRNTTWILAVVVYTGKKTKIQMVQCSTYFTI